MFPNARAWFKRKARRSLPPQNDYRQSLNVRLNLERLSERDLPGSLLALSDADFSDKFDIAPPTNTNTNAIPPLVPAIMRTLSHAEALPFTPAPEASSIALISPIPPRADIAPVTFDPTLGDSLAPTPLFPLGAFAGFSGGVHLGESHAPTSPQVASAPSVAPAPAMSASAVEPVSEPLVAAAPTTPVDTLTCTPTTLYENDFEGTVGSEWSNTKTSRTPTGGRSFLGDFGNNTVTLTLDDVPDGAEVHLAFDLYIIRSWDGSVGEFAGPDTFTSAVVGGSVLDSRTYSNGIGGPASGMATETNSLGYKFKYTSGERPSDSVYHHAFTINHSSGPLEISFAGSGLQSLSDESWGLDNVKVDVCAKPLVTVSKLSDTSEGDKNPGGFRFSRTGDTTLPLPVDYSVSVSSTAAPTSDYATLTGTATILAGNSYVDVAVIALNDLAPEETESVIVTVTPSAEYDVDEDAIDVVYIADDDAYPGVIGGTAWYDADGDGIRQLTELPASGIAVTLRDENGDRLYDTTTVGDGSYQFRGLEVNKSYYVQMYPPREYWFSPKDQVGPLGDANEATDSDMDPETGWSDAIPLTAATFPSSGAFPKNLYVDGGFVKTAPPDEPDKSIIFTDKMGNKIGAGGLKVAKWHDAFEANPGQPTEPRVKGPLPSNNYDFIDRDNDRFNVRVRDDEMWKKLKADMTPEVPFIYVDISTTNAAANNKYDDPATKISLSRDPNKEGWYWSDSLLLVSNKVDDEFRNVGYLAGDEAIPIATTKTYMKHGYRFQVSDRTHRIALGGTVKAEYAGIANPATATVKVEKTLKLHVTILNDKVGDGQKPVIATTKVNDDITKMREIFAQLGIRVIIVDDNSAEIASVGNAQIKDPPPGVILDDGTGLSVDPRTERDAFNNYKMTQEEKALLDHAAYRTPETNGNKDIEVYYVNSMKSNIAVAGIAYPTSSIPDDKYKYSVIMTPTDIYMTLAHEAMHILINNGLHEGDGNPTALQRTNILVTGLKIIDTGTKEIDSRRVTPEQAEKVVMHNEISNLMQ